MPFKFNFFRGIITLNELSNPQPRYPRTPMGQIPYSENCETPGEKRTFRLGWRACERGAAIHENLYSNQENLIYSLHRLWERGWLECYHHHPSRVINEQS